MPDKTFRVPIVGPYTNRVSEANSLMSASGYAGAGIAGVMIAGGTTSSTNKDQRFLNCFAETIVDPITSKKRVYCVKRPGFATSTTPQAGSIGNALMVWTGQGAGTGVISAFGATNSTLYNGATGIGTITGLATSISETFVTTTATLVVPSSDSTAWYYDTGVAIMTKIADADFPGNAGYTLAGNFAHIDGFACIMTTDGKLWASDLNSVTAWTANSYTSTNSYPDKGVGCVRYKELVMAFGTESVEFYQNAGLTPFPLQAIGNMTLKVGAVSAAGIAQISDTIFWTGITPQGGVSVFQFDGNISRVSSPDIDNILILAGTTNLSMTAARFYGRSFIIVNAGTTALVYCVEEKMWSQWSSTVPLWYKCASVATGGTLATYSISNLSTSGKVYVLNPVFPTFQDDGNTYTATAQMALMDLGTMRRKEWKRLSVIADVEASASNLTISFSDDDYGSYTTFGTIDLSSLDQYVTRLGSSRRRGWAFTHSANTPMRIEAIEGVVGIGTS